MDEAALRRLCCDQNLYKTPHLNDSLFAGNQGFLTLGGLDAYTGLRALHLEHNALESLHGLPPLPHLLCLCGATLLRTFAFGQTSDCSLLCCFGRYALC